MSTRKRCPPSYQHHQASGQARVRIDGRDYYLGPHGSPESKERYSDLIAQWRLSSGTTDRYTLTVDELALAYLEYAKLYYRKAGRETSEVHCIRSVLKHLVAVAGPSRAREFGPKLLKAVRDRMIAAGDCRNTINQNVGRIRRFFKWAIGEEFLPPAILVGLQAVHGLRAGRSDAVDRPPVRPVSQAAIDAIEPFVSRVIWGMIQLQLVTGAPPGEVIMMRGCDLNTTSSVWEYKPQSHKTEHHRRIRTILFGPKAQAILRPFLKTDLQAYLFNPREAVEELNLKRARERNTPVRHNHRPSSTGKRQPGRTPGERYDRSAYRNAILRACERAFEMPPELRNPDYKLEDVSADARGALRGQRLTQAAKWRADHCWHPHQLRHNAGTQIRREAGLETAKCVLGHSTIATTELYAEQDLERARDIIALVG